MRKQQSGIFLISAAIAVAVLGVMISFWGVHQARQMRTEKAERMGEALKLMGDKVQSFVVEHHNAIVALLGPSAKPFTVRGVTFERRQDWLGRPSIDNLTASRLLTATNATGMGTRPPGSRGEYGIHVYLECDKATNVCNIETLTYIDTPIYKTYGTAPDWDAAAVAVRKIGALGGIQHDGGQVFRFLDSSGQTGTVASPLGKPGLIAVRGGYSTSAMDVYVRRDGSTMRGPLDFEERDAQGGRVKRHDIVGVGKLDAERLSGASLTASAATVSGPLVANSATLQGQLDMGGNGANHSIVGAQDISGTGTLRMGAMELTGPAAAQSLVVGGPANVGARLSVAGDTVLEGKLSAKNGAKLDGKLEMSGNDIVKADKVEADLFRSAKGVVELNGAKQQGEECHVWGLTRDADGRLLSCQRSRPGSNTWHWKLASTPGSVTDVPTYIVKEIEKLVRVDDHWKVTRYSLTPSRAGLRLGSALYFYVASQSDATLLACAVTNVGRGGASIRPGASQGEYIVTQSPRGTEQLVCLSKGAGTPYVRENAWFWRGWPTIDVHGSVVKSGFWSVRDFVSKLPSIHRDVRKPDKILKDTDTGFARELKQLFDTFGTWASAGDLNAPIAQGGMGFYRYTTRHLGGTSAVLVKNPNGPVSCKIRSDFAGAFLDHSSDTIRVGTRAAHTAGPGRTLAVDVQCAFSRASDLHNSSFTPCSPGTCPLP